MDNRAVEMVGQIRATRAAGFPARTEHKVIDDQLAFAVEQISEGLCAGRRLADVIFVDFLPRQFAAFTGERVAGSGERLFLSEMSFARGNPFVVGNDLVRFHLRFLLIWSR